MVVMEKDFDAWNIKKQELDVNRRKLIFKEGEIWWCSLGINIGEEAYGKGVAFRRPVLVLKKLSFNSCIVIPTTTKEHAGIWYYHVNVARKDRWFMMHQVRFISANRMYVRESILSKEQFIELKKAVARLLGL
jgi:mRNA interferase MazF